MKKGKPKGVCVLSGGTDSTTLLYKMRAKGFDVYAIGFDYGQKHSKELEYAAKTCEKLGVPYRVVMMPKIDGSALTENNQIVPEGHYEDKSMKSTVVPNRNAIMLNYAVAYAISIDARTVGYGAHAGDHAIYPDCRPVFLQAMRKLAKVCHYFPIKIYAPFIKASKADVIKEGMELGVDYDLTWSCYKGGKTHCGRCGTCVERFEAFGLAGYDYEGHG